MTLIARRAPTAAATARRVRVVSRPTSKETTISGRDRARAQWRQQAAFRPRCRHRRTSRGRFPARSAGPRDFGGGSRPERPPEALAAGDSACAWRRRPPTARPRSTLPESASPRPSDRSATPPGAPARARSRGSRRRTHAAARSHPPRPRRPVTTRSTMRRPKRSRRRPLSLDAFVSSRPTSPQHDDSEGREEGGAARRDVAGGRASGGDGSGGRGGAGLPHYRYVLRGRPPSPLVRTDLR